MNAYPSKLVERAVEQLSTLPGVGAQDRSTLGATPALTPPIDTHTSPMPS